MIGVESMLKKRKTHTFKISINIRGVFKGVKKGIMAVYRYCTFFMRLFRG